MNYESINGENLKAMYVGGTSLLKNNASYINDLNVFPVPDGDTGLNMTKTLEGGLQRIISCEETDASIIASKFTHGALFGARGNSGVILSQILKGISTGIQNLHTVQLKEFEKAFSVAVETAYHSVDNPVEGTILTVVREATEYAINNTVKYIDEFLKIHLEQAKRTLLKTKEILPALKDANVVDSGGAGYVCFVEGMYRGLIGEEIAVTEDFSTETTSQINYSLFTRDSQLTYGYCTEVMIRLQTSKVNVETFDANVILEFLKSIDGESIVCYKDEDVVKIHVHLKNPGLVLTECQKYGEFLSVKIENMTLQHNEAENKKVKHKTNAIVTVANGEGMIEVFTEFGADAIINGGQTGNPSSDDFINAFDTLNADNIFVLPNNSNIYLAANQAKKLYKKCNVIVLKTKSFEQGYVALSVFDSDTTDTEMLISDMQATIDGVTSLETTYAVRDAVINGIDIKKGHFMSFINSNLVCTDEDEITSVLKAISLVDDIENKESLTIFFGESVTDEEKQKFLQLLEENYPDLITTVFDGGQKVYRFIIGIE